MSQQADPPLRILSLDGGGIRGKSSLLILESIMEKMRKSRRLKETPRPCEMFDLIGGTSTGGIIAIMLGRLGMSVDECIRAYDRVGEAAFTPKSGFRLASPKGAFSATALETAIKEVVRTNCVRSSCTEERSQGYSTTKTCPHGEMKFRSKICTKTAVLAITKDNVDAPPTLFTTYDTSTALDDCAIWEIARATSAATTFFKPIRLGRDKIDFVDAGFGYNNPCEVLIEEARREFPHRSHWQVLSIGTGLGNVVSIKDSRWSIVKALKQMATTSKKVATRLEDQYGGSGNYYRFNVERGLEDVTLSDWQRTSNISAHTNNYLRENRRGIDEFVASFLSKPVQEEPGTAKPDEPSSSRAHYFLPLQENECFVRRVKILDALEKSLFQKHRREVALVGLGGAGKTQIALQFAHDIKASKGETSVFWISALSNESFDQSCSAITSLLNIGNVKDDPKELLRSYFRSKKAGECLIILDNADDDKILYGKSGTRGLYKYLSGLRHVQILFTTRSNDLAMRNFQREVIHVTDMEVKEATMLLKNLSVPRKLLQDKAQIIELLDELTYLPLAISQAAAYLRRNGISIARYLELLHGEEQSMVALMSREFNDNTLYEKSQRAVATTWLVSFDQIQKTDKLAAEILGFLSCIEPKAIPESLLTRFRKSTELKITEALGTLSGYSFVKRQEDGRSLIMHSLVHLAVRIWLRESGQAKATVEAALKQISNRFPDKKWENRMIWREYMPHAMKILQDMSTIDLKTRHDLNYRVGLCLYIEGRYADAVTRLEEARQWSQRHLQEDDYDRQYTEFELAGAYLDNGQVKDAIGILEQMVEIDKTTLAENDPNRLGSHHELARAYLQNGQVKAAIAILEQVVEIQSSTLAEDHPGRLVSQHELARAYLDNGQVKDAIGILEQVVEIRSSIMAEDHPDRLTSEYALGYAYLKRGEASRAVKLLEHVVGVRRSVLEDDHPHRLMSERLLEDIYEALRVSYDSE